MFNNKYTCLWKIVQLLFSYICKHQLFETKCLFLRRKSMIMYWRKTTYLFPNFFIWLFNCVIIKSYYLKWFVVQNLCLCLLQLIKMKGYCSIWFGKTVFNHLKWVSKIILLQNLVSNNQLRMMIMERLLVDNIQ